MTTQRPDVDGGLLIDLNEAVREILRSCLRDDVIDRFASTLVRVPAISTALAAGEPLRDVGRRLIGEAIDRQPPPERAALRVMAGLEPGWLPSRGRTREDRKSAMGRRLLPHDPARPDQGLGTRRIEQLERRVLAPSVADALLSGDLSRSATNSRSFRDRPFFAQFINPELLVLHNEDRLLGAPGILRTRLMWTTRLALLGSLSGLILPASYLYEVPYVSSFLLDARDLWDAGAIHLTGPISDLIGYRESKAFEYRDERTNPYDKEISSASAISAGVQWRPRRGGTAVRDISAAWRQELHPEARLGDLVMDIAASTGIRRAVRRLELVPEQLDGRAFIAKYVIRAIGQPLSTGSRSSIQWLLSSEYVKGYLEDLDANLLVDLPYGAYSVPLAQSRDEDNRAISARRLAALVRAIGLGDTLDGDTAWKDLIDIRASIELDLLISLLWDRDSVERWKRLARFRKQAQAPATSDSAAAKVIWLGEIVSRVA